MALSDIRQFLTDLLLRWDPDLDVSQGSAAETQIIVPILSRIGPDPFDNDITSFITERIRQVYPDIAMTDADAFTDTTIDPMRTLIEPLVREIKLIKLRSSLRNAESLSDEEVDSLAGNFLKTRAAGGLARGIVRLYYANPQGASVTLVHPARTRSGLRFYPTRPQAITSDQMLLNRSGTEYYFDVNYTAEKRGSEYNVDPQAIVSVANLPAVTRVANLSRFRDGIARESSLDFLARVENGLGDETLAVARGVVGVLGEAYPAAQHIFVVGFGDPEMKRDVLTGGGAGRIPSSDISGAFYGEGAVVDDGSASARTSIIELTGASLVSRVGAIGTAPEGWVLTMSYVSGAEGLVIFDADLLEVLADDQALIDGTLPLTPAPTLVHWALRRNMLTLSDIPGGITIPNNVDGTLDVPPDQVHIGGKTDVYTIGPLDRETVQLLSVTDANPFARGINASTSASTVVDLIDFAGEAPYGASLVLEEGSDAGSYRILAQDGTEVTLDTALTGTQTSLSWKIVDEIDVELTDPRDVRVSGNDLITAAGSALVGTAGAVNFTDAGVQVGDILEVEGGGCAGEYAVTVVGATTLEVDPPMPRTVPASSYSVFRRSEAIQPPVVRVASMELLDSAGAPVGTKIPYAEPVLVESRAFQNEGSGYLYDGEVRLGLLLGTDFSDITGRTLDLGVFDPDAVWAGVEDMLSITFASVADAADAADEINADATFIAAGVSATVVTYAGDVYVGIVSTRLVVITGGDAVSEWDNFEGESNAMARGVGLTFQAARVGAGDVLEVISGPNAGHTSRVVHEVTDSVLFSDGPTGPVGTSGLYNNHIFRPSMGALARIGRGSVGSGRVYFLEPTSAEFRYGETRFTVETATQTLTYRPDPENTRVLLPAPPLTELPTEGELATGSPAELTDTSLNFLALGIRPGDVLVVKYRPIEGDAGGLSAGALSLSGTVLRLRLDTDPYISVSFPTDMARQDAVDYINEQVGSVIADLNDNDALRLRSTRRIEVDSTSTALVALELDASPTSTVHPDAGEYIIAVVEETVLTLSDATAQPADVTPSTQYFIRRYLQRSSSTEMQLKQDATGMYYVDVEIVAEGPGDHYNIEAGVVMQSSGHVSDGFRLSTGNSVLSYSVAERLYATLSRSILLPGSADSPQEAIQLSRQNIQVTYDRSSLVSEMQSFASSDLQRTLLGEILIRHLLPHFVSLNWVYAGGALEPSMAEELRTWIAGVEPGGDELEVGDLTAVMRKNGAVSTYTPDTATVAGRRAPLLVVVYHDTDRGTYARVVRDVVSTERLQGFIPETLTVRRSS